MSAPSTHLSRPRSPRGFTLIEAVVASMIVGIMFVAAMSAIAAAARARKVQADIRRAEGLARSLMSEITRCAYQDRTSPVFGVESAENASSRLTWDDVDDYHGFSETSATARDGTAVAGFTGWRRSVTVEQVSASDPAGAGLVPTLLAALLPAQNTGLRRITVVVETPGRKPTKLVALRSAWGVWDRSLTPGVSTVSNATVDLQVGKNAKSMTTGAEIMNAPQP